MFVLIPTLELSHIEVFFREFENYDVSTVDKFLIFNNSGRYFDYLHPKVEVFTFRNNAGVNYCWNRGLAIAKNENKDLMFLNDDVKIKPDFFIKTQEALDNKSFMSVICPITTNDLKEFKNYSFDKRVRFRRMKKREGWAFTIRKEVIPNIRPIPEDLKIFFGDDWLWLMTHGRWIKDFSNVIYHSIGKTMKKHPEIRAILNEERRIYTLELEKLI